MEIQIKSTVGKREEVKKLLDNLTSAFLKEGINIDRAMISGKRVNIFCDSPKKAFKISSKIFGVEKVSFGEKEIQGIGGFPIGSKGKIKLDVKNKKLAKKILNRKGIEISDDSRYIASKDVKKHKKNGVFALDPFFGLR